MGTVDLVSVYLAGIVQRSAFDCHRMHRAGGIHRLLLARTGYGVRASRRRAAPPMGRDVAGELDRYAGNGGRRGDLLLYSAAALPAHYDDWAAFKSSMVRCDGNDWLDHLRGPDALQCCPGL